MTTILIPTALGASSRSPGVSPSSSYATAPEVQQQHPNDTSQLNISLTESFESTEVSIRPTAVVEQLRVVGGANDCHHPIGPSPSSPFVPPDVPKSESNVRNSITLTESFESTEVSILPAEPEELVRDKESSSSSLKAPELTKTPPLSANHNHTNTISPRRTKWTPFPKSSPTNVVATKGSFYGKSPTSTPTRVIGGSDPGGQRYFRLRPSFHCLASPKPQDHEALQHPLADLQPQQQEVEQESIGTNTTGEASSLDREDHDEDVSNSGSKCSSRVERSSSAGGDDKKKSTGAADHADSPSRLFRERNDIVAFQEWPSRYRPRTQAVETIATQLGRSPVRVKFNPTADIVDDGKSPHNNDDDLLTPVTIAGRIPTGLNMPLPDPESDNKNGCFGTDSILGAILSTMMCASPSSSQQTTTRRSSA